jgi:hypothetical protein
MAPWGAGYGALPDGDGLTGPAGIDHVSFKTRSGLLPPAVWDKIDAQASTAQNEDSSASPWFSCSLLARLARKVAGGVSPCSVRLLGIPHLTAAVSAAISTRYSPQ